MSEQKMKIFQDVDLTAAKKEHLDVDFDALYEKADAELGLQQSKRDQIVTIYLTMFSFLLPFALSLEGIGWQAKGFILLAVAIIGVLFSMIVVRYRYYKEIYWLCCRSITALMNVRSEKLSIKVVKGVFARMMMREGGKLIEEKNNKRRFKPGECVRNNLFSAETIYYMILSLITSVLAGLSVALITGLTLWMAVAVGVVVAFVMMSQLLRMYFRKLKEVYEPLVTDDPAAFDKVFRKAWFLDLDVEI